LPYIATWTPAALSTAGSVSAALTRSNQGHVVVQHARAARLLACKDARARGVAKRHLRNRVLEGRAHVGEAVHVRRGD
jgi:hypothetical protein